MSTQVKRRRGTKAENAAFTGAEGEVVVLTDTKQMAVHDAVTQGGFIIPNDPDIVGNYFNFATSSGTNTITATMETKITAYATGQTFLFKAGGTNTGAATLNINSLGAKTIKNIAGGVKTDVGAGDITLSQIYQVIYDGTDLVLMGGGSGGVDRQDFTASGTWTKPSGFSADATVMIELWAGGGGGGSQGSSGDYGGGGGGGSYNRVFYKLSDLNTAEGVTVGAGGAGSTTTAAGGVGGISLIDTLASGAVRAYGGGGGGGASTGDSGGGGGGSARNSGGSGTGAGNGGAGGICGGGDGGGSAAVGSNGNPAVTEWGGAGGGSGDAGAPRSGAASCYGGAGGGGAHGVGAGSGGSSINTAIGTLHGGDGAATNNANGQDAPSYCGGGGGAGGTGDGGDGGDGYVRITVY